MLLQKKNSNPSLRQDADETSHLIARYLFTINQFVSFLIMLPDQLRRGRTIKTLLQKYKDTRSK